MVVRRWVATPEHVFGLRKRCPMAGRRAATANARDLPGDPGMSISVRRSEQKSSGQ